MKKQTLTVPTLSDLVFLRGRKVTLRPYSEKDIPYLVKWINDPEIRKYVTRTMPANEKNEQDWLNRIHSQEKDLVALIIQVKGVPIGNIGLGINWVERIGTVGIIIGEEKYQSSGFGKDASMTLIEYAFNTLNLRKIEWMAKSFNERSLACARSCGFKIEGRMREEYFFDGRYWDEIIHGMFKSEWLPKYEAYQKKK
ncbi:MAG: GNAT family protein [Patescibacteria group bacterium]